MDWGYARKGDPAIGAGKRDDGNATEAQSDSLAHARSSREEKCAQLVAPSEKGWSVHQAVTSALLVVTVWSGLGKDEPCFDRARCQSHGQQFRQRNRR